MKLLAAGLALAIAGTAALHPLLGSGNRFDAIVSAVETKYHRQPQHIPMLWLAGAMAGAYTGGGVRHLKLAEFDNFSGPASPEELDRLIGGRLDSQWQRMVLERESNGGISLIYVRPEHGSMRMLAANYDHHELDIVRMDLNGAQLASFLDNPRHAPSPHSAQPE
jgi:hypothetical protein